MNKPSNVKIAVKLVYYSLGIGVLRAIIEAPGILAQNIALRNAFAGGDHAVISFLVVTYLVAFGMVWFLAYMCGRGRNWARITFLVLFITGLPFSISPLLQSLSAYPFSGLLGIGQTVMQLVTVVCLFQKSSSEWFKFKKNEAMAKKMASKESMSQT